MKRSAIHGSGSETWVRFDLSAVLCQLERIYGNLSEQAERFYTDFVQPAARKGILLGPVSGSNYAETEAFADPRTLALQLFYDAVVTSRNALGRSATVTRKFHVFSLRVANVPACMRDSTCILPLAIVPPAAWSKHGFDGIIQELKHDFDLLHSGICPDVKVCAVCF